MPYKGSLIFSDVHLLLHKNVFCAYYLVLVKVQVHGLLKNQRDGSSQSTMGNYCWASLYCTDKSFLGAQHCGCEKANTYDAAQSPTRVRIDPVGDALPISFLTLSRDRASQFCLETLFCILISPVGS